MGTGPGLKITHPFCPDCGQTVECRVLVLSDGRTVIISGPEEHKQICISTAKRDA